MKLVDAHRDWLPNALMRVAARFDTQARWGLNNGMWTIGGNGYAELIRRTAGYSLKGLAERIRTPALIMNAEADQFFKGQPDALAENMTAPATVVSLTTAEGAGEHCHVGSLLRAHQVIFDWLDDLVTNETQARAKSALKSDRLATLAMRTPWPSRQEGPS